MCPHVNSTGIWAASPGLESVYFIFFYNKYSPLQKKMCERLSNLTENEEKKKKSNTDG